MAKATETATLPPAEAEQRFEQAIRRALGTPPQPRKPTPKRAPKAKASRKPLK